MNKAEFIDAVAQKSGLSKKDTKLMVESSLDVIIETLAKKEDITFIGFWSFITSQRGARTTRVPGQDGLLEVAPTTVAKFKVGKTLKDAVAK